MKELFTLILIYVPLLLNSQTLEAEFVASPLEICLGEEIQFTDQSTAGASPITNWTWDFGDGSSSNSQNTLHTYTNTGTFNITLTIQAQDGSSDTEVKPLYITVNPNPIADFLLVGSPCSIPFDASFTNNSETGANIEYAWDFGNGQTSTDFNPLGITYTNTGTYDVSLTVTNNVTGCSSTFNSQTDVTEFQADITTTDSVCINQTVQIDDASSTGVDLWSWDFGDGSSSTSQNNTHIYTASGTYTVTLISQNSITGCIDTVTTDIVVLPLPTPSFVGNPLVGCAPLSVTFVNTSAGTGTFVWDFGNGNTFNGQNPPIEVYNALGSYDVSLTMLDNFGCSNTISIAGMISVEALEVGFMADVVEGCDPLSVQFTDTSIVPNPAQDPIVSWSWDFGNGNTFIGQNPPVEIYSVGTYDVNLSITTANGCSADTTFIEYIQVGSIDLVDFSVDPTIECAKTDIDFTDLSVISVPFDPGEVEYAWDFGDGGTSTLQNPTYMYPSDTGYFDVQLVVNFRGCMDTAIITQAVYIMAPISLFSPANTLYCNPESFPVSVDITDNSIIGTIPDDAEMIWDWGDGTFTFFDDPDFDDPNLGSTTHDYTAYGSYTIEQVIHNYTTGCSDTTSVVVHISETIADFSFTNDSVCVFSDITLTDNSTSTHPFGTYVFDMGNSDTLIGATQTYAYQSSGSYDIILTATNSVGCAATDTLFGMDVLELPLADIIPSISAGCAPVDVVFTNNSSPQGNGVGLSSFAWTFPDMSTQLTTDINQSVNYFIDTEGTFSTSLTVTDNFGCISPTTTIVTNITKPTADFIVDSVVCDLENFIGFNTSTGVQPVTYEWLVDGNVQSTNVDFNGQFDENSSSSSNSVPHTLELIATDANGCMDTISANIIVSMPYANANATFVSASINEFGEFTCPPVFASLEDTSLTYGSIVSWQWDLGNGNASNLQNPQNTYVFSGVYTATLTITDEFGCVDDTVLTDFLTILGPTAEPTWTSIGNICLPQFEFSATNQNSVASIVWDLGNGTIISDTNSFNYTYLQSGSYTPTVIVSDASGCQVPYSLNTITVGSDVLNAFFVASMESGDIFETFIFDDQSTGGSGPIDQWNWDLTTDFISNITDEDVAYAWDIPGQQTVTLTVIDVNGCESSYAITVNVTAEITIPNVFTPNNDGVNDLFTIEYDIFDGYDIVILNRWGNVVHEINDHSGVVLWDGIDLSGVPCIDGVYFYKLNGTLFDGTQLTKHGPVTLLRGMQ